MPVVDVVAPREPVLEPCPLDGPQGSRLQPLKKTRTAPESATLWFHRRISSSSNNRHSLVAK